MPIKLYYSPGACSLSVHIALRETNTPFELVKVNLADHTLAESGEDYMKISPRGYVPLIELEDGSRHTEAGALLQYVGDLDETHAVFPALGTQERFQVLQWLTFMSTEIHKVYSPWLWHKETAESTQEMARKKLGVRYDEINRHLANNEYLIGKQFTVADAYCFTLTRWAHFLKVDLSKFDNINQYMKRVAERPKVHEALLAEGLIK